MENPQGHSRTCAESDAPKNECTCRCNTTLHGILSKTPSEETPRPWEVPRHQAKKPRRKKTKLAAAAAVLTVTGTLGGLTATGTFSSASGLSVQAKVDLNKATSTLAGLGFGGKLLSSIGVSSTTDPTNCVESATGQVKNFLTHYPCKQYAADTWAITRQGSTTDVVFAWVEMPTTALASRYKSVVDTINTGNPPGVSSAFNGLCYASGQQNMTVWTVEIEPTGKLNTDRMILQAATPANLSSAYLTEHCVT